MGRGPCIKYLYNTCTSTSLIKDDATSSVVLIMQKETFWLFTVTDGSVRSEGFKCYFKGVLNTEGNDQ